jgi:hypothetical protein
MQETNGTEPPKAGPPPIIGTCLLATLTLTTSTWSSSTFFNYGEITYSQQKSGKA